MNVKFKYLVEKYILYRDLFLTTSGKRCIGIFDRVSPYRRSPGKRAFLLKSEQNAYVLVSLTTAHMSTFIVSVQI